MTRRKKQLFSLRKTLLTSFIGLLLWGGFWVVDTIHYSRLPQPNTPAEFYATQVRDDLRHTLVSAIRSAEKSITLIIYALTDGKMIQALKTQAEAGVTTTVICDPTTSPYLEQRLGKRVNLYLRHNKGLMHQKILVVDKEYVWLGSANMTPESLSVHGNLVMAFHSPAMAHMVSAKAESLIQQDALRIFPQQSFSILGQNVQLWFLPDNPHAVRQLIQLIRAAQKTLRVAMFTWTRHDLANEVIEAKNRGIDVEVAIDYNQGKGSGAEVVKRLVQGGIPVYLSKGSALLHHKFLYIDQKVLVNGSANWTKAAFTKNDDCFVTMDPLTNEQAQMMDRLWDRIKEGCNRVKRL